MSSREIASRQTRRLARITPARTRSAAPRARLARGAHPYPLVAPSHARRSRSRADDPRAVIGRCVPGCVGAAVGHARSTSCRRVPAPVVRGAGHGRGIRCRRYTGDGGGRRGGRPTPRCSRGGRRSFGRRGVRRRSRGIGGAIGGVSRAGREGSPWGWGLVGGGAGGVEFGAGGARRGGFQLPAQSRGGVGAADHDAGVSVRRGETRRLHRARSPSVSSSAE